MRSPISDEASIESESTDAQPLPARGAGTAKRPTIKSFQSLVGSLLWVARCSRPDIAYAVHRATRRSHAPSDHDMKLARQVLRYLGGTAAMKLLMGGASSANEVRLTSYTDAEFAADKATLKSISCAVLIVDGIPVGWQVKQESSVAFSTAEAEAQYLAAAVGVGEILGLKSLLREINVSLKFPMQVILYNQDTIKQIANVATSSAQKHGDVKMKFVRGTRSKGIVKLEYIATNEKIADLLTQSVPSPVVADLREMMELR